MPLYVVMVSGPKEKNGQESTNDSAAGSVGLVRRRGSSQWLRQDSVASTSSSGRSLFQRAADGGASLRVDKCRVVLTRIPELDALTKNTPSVRLPPEATEADLRKTLNHTRSEPPVEEDPQYVLKTEPKLCKIDLAALGLPAPPEDMPEIDVLTPCCSQIDMFSFGLASFPTLPKPTPHIDLYDKNFPATKGCRVELHCCECLRLMSVKDFVKHISVCLKNGEQCPLCGRCKPMEGLSAHVLRHFILNELRQPVCCPLCPAVLYNETNLTLHELSIHL
ncbi:Hypothetical predicted protein [Cloeon dipterum]|uniref:C2H2-type domain-containing protein n=1 Tax=Cloeon dipterum TaxID=197152 RepID=A0A8S1DUA0_9INSE|nr:Hypothetical predicted protein [Cloeon dipterum]